METITLTPQEFEEKLKTVTRFWDAPKQIAHAQNQVSEELRNKMNWIFIRDDGWSIASEFYNEGVKIWPDEYVKVYRHT